MDYRVHTGLNVSQCTTYKSCKLKILLAYIYYIKDIQFTLLRKYEFKIDLLK